MEKKNTFIPDLLRTKGYVQDANGNFHPRSSVPDKKTPKPPVLKETVQLSAWPNEPKISTERFIFIPHDVISKKNSKNIVPNRNRNGKNKSPYLLIDSTAAKNYKTITKLAYSANAVIFRQMLVGKQKPYRIGMQFARKTRGRFDYNNISQMVCDLMVENRWLEDDNANEMIPVFLPYVHDKLNPGVYITVL